MPLPLIPIATTVGRVALPKLAQEFAKRGGTAFIKQYGKKAFQAVTGGSAGAIAYDQTINRSVPVTTGQGDYIGDTGQKEKERARIAEENKERMKGSPAPVIKTWEESFPDQSGEIVDSSPPPSVPEPIKIPQESFPDLSDEANKPQIFYSKKDDIKKQTDTLVPKKVEVGPLSDTEKQTALALGESQPDYYSRVVKAIQDTKQNKMPKEQWASIINKSGTKKEIEFLGLADFAGNKESITKQELLESIKDKNIATDLTFTKIPGEDQIDFSTYSLGGAKGTTGQYVIQVNKDSDDIRDLEFGLAKRIYQATGSHLKEKYGRNTVAHARTQIGYYPYQLEDLESEEDLDPATDEPAIYKASQKLKNTFIIDEVQSDWIQDIQEQGTKKDFVIKKGSDIDSEFINKNYGNKYELKTSKFSTMKQTLEETGLQYNKVLYVTDQTTGIGTVLTSIDPDRYYTFSKNRIDMASGHRTEQDAKEHIERVGISDLPITQSKEYVKIMLNSLIKEAAILGTDSIGITNGQIQADRYEGQDDEESKGLKNFYDKIVIPQLEKIAKQNGVEIERVSISDPEFSEEDDKKSIPNRMKMSMQNGFELRKIDANMLYATLNDVEKIVPDFFTIYSDGGRGQGANRIMDVIENDEPNVAKRLKNPKEYFIWVKKGSALSGILEKKQDFISLKDYIDNSTVDFSMPLTIADPNNNLTTKDDMEVGETRLEKINNYRDFINTTNLTNYSSYILDYKSKGIDLGYEHDEHQIIKMPLPKELLKKALTEPIKVSKLKSQTNRLFA
tara:strand:+ start:634 stop:2997 length:2364 start_codon:yes stop_codon:yes gene_type:complete